MEFEPSSAQDIDRLTVAIGAQLLSDCLAFLQSYGRSMINGEADVLGHGLTTFYGTGSDVGNVISDYLSHDDSGGKSGPDPPVARALAGVWGMQIVSRTVIGLNLLVSVIALGLSGAALLQTRTLASTDRVITARGVIVQDASGHSRVILGAPIPEPVVRGKVAKREGALAGVVLIGPDGNERGAYATGDSGGGALLTLDSADASAEVFKVVANPDTGATVVVAHQNNAAAVLTTYRGIPELQLIDKEGTAQFAQPPGAPRLQ